MVAGAKFYARCAWDLTAFISLVHNSYAKVMTFTLSLRCCVFVWSFSTIKIIDSAKV